MEPIIIYGTALILGSVHAFEADHVAAVTTFATRSPGIRSATAFGFRWAAGHGVAVLIIGSALIMLRSELPHAATHSLERLVGLVLMGLGAWTIWGARRLHVHRHAHVEGTIHEHFHSHLLGPGHEHRHGVTSIGLLHGAAGSAGAAALVPIASLGNAAGGILYLAVFGVGTILGMTAYALVAGFLVGRSVRFSPKLARGLATAAGAITLAIGAIWLVR